LVAVSPVFLVSKSASRVLRVRGAVALGVAASGRYDLRDQIEFGSGQSRLDVQQRLDNKNFFSCIKEVSLN
jgi:hypothetical protein